MQIAQRGLGHNQTGYHHEVARSNTEDRTKPDIGLNGSRRGAPRTLCSCGARAVQSNKVFSAAGEPSENSIYIVCALKTHIRFQTLGGRASETPTYGPPKGGTTSGLFGCQRAPLARIACADIVKAMYRG